MLYGVLEWHQNGSTQTTEGEGPALDQRAWRQIPEAQRLLQAHFPELVLVGETAAALHAGHRHSLDGDHVMTELREHFDGVLARLEALAAWSTRRVRPPVMILGRFQGVETGIRQLVRSVPLETQEIEGIRVPTLAEMARIKAWLVVTRNATRDFVDLCALSAKLEDGVEDALRPLDDLYPQSSGETVTRQLCRQLAEPRPFDLGSVDLRRHHGIRAPWNRWEHVEATCNELSDRLARGILGLQE
ncbi:hypothetical protein LIP_3449 [Limnochorda pilosa]|uniref:Uncharacterized protein n=1 Tax=Limnochorda pilosa TaxID=1555112 RepID=A0A0K2SQ85_LIMPI|nr:hypothetical protein LIP_3449 [Limnochorda pilosa]